MWYALKIGSRRDDFVGTTEQVKLFDSKGKGTGDALLSVERAFQVALEIWLARKMKTAER